MSIASKAGKFFIGAFIFMSGCTFTAAVTNYNNTGEAAPSKAKVIKKAKPVKAKAKRKAPAKVETRKAKVEPFRYQESRKPSRELVPVAPASKPEKISVTVNIVVDNTASAS